jgi:dGTPase
MTTAQITMQNEKFLLSQYAQFASATKGRARPEQECSIRTPFQRDRDRIIHSKSFRRLMNKTQVFLAPEGDHYRTRLTHTLEVSQIARTIARALSLNEDLTEAISLGHDLGHTPFGHAGERALNQVCSSGFTHYRQSLRVVERLEKNGLGLNLTWEVRDGIFNHATDHMIPATLEGRVVKISDRIAYINHDIDDALRAGVLSEKDLPRDIVAVLGSRNSIRINTMITSLIHSSRKTDCIAFSAEVSDAMMALRSFLFQAVYTNPVAKGQEGKAVDMLVKLYLYFCKHPGRMPEEYVNIAKEDGLEQAVCDYLAGMTDRYAVQVFTDLFVPSFWFT